MMMVVAMVMVPMIPLPKAAMVLHHYLGSVGNMQMVG